MTKLLIAILTLVLAFTACTNTPPPPISPQPEAASLKISAAKTVGISSQMLEFSVTGTGVSDVGVYISAIEPARLYVKSVNGTFDRVFQVDVAKIDATPHNMAVDANWLSGNLATFAFVDARAELPDGRIIRASQKFSWITDELPYTWGKVALQQQGTRVCDQGFLPYSGAGVLVTTYVSLEKAITMMTGDAKSASEGNLPRATLKPVSGFCLDPVSRYVQYRSGFDPHWVVVSMYGQGGESWVFIEWAPDVTN